MEESSKLRLVRCPKCQNLLPELPDYSVYQCGGCGAVLRAKKGNLEGVNGSQRSEEERVGVVSDKSENGKAEIFVGKGADSGAENGEVRVSDSEGSDETVAEKFGNDSKPVVGTLALEDENPIKNELSNGNLDAKLDKLETRVENGNGVRRSGRLFERKPSDKGEEDGLGRIKRDYFEGVRLSSSNQVGEGTSKSNLDSSYRNEASRATRAEYMDTDREELLRKLDELKEQLSRVQNMNDKSRDKIPLENRMAHAEPYVEHDDYFRNHPSGVHRVSRQFSAPNNHVSGAPYFEHRHEPFPVTSRSDIGMHNYHNHVPRYEDSFEPQMFRRPPPPPRRIPSHHQYMGPETDPFDPHPYDTSTTLHKLSCSCYQCYDRQPQVPLQIPLPPAFGNRRYPHVANKPAPYHHDLHGGFGSHGYNSRMVNTPPLGSCDPQPHTRWPSDLNLETGALARARPQRVVLANNGHRCHPVAGGAPFVTCNSCFELLKLPQRVFSKKGEWKMSCGACSSAISFAVVDEKLVPVDTSVKQSTRSTTEARDSSNEVGYGYVKRDNASFCSEDYANSAYDFQALDREPVSSSIFQGVSSSKSEEMNSLHSVSETTSDDERFSDDLIARQGVTSTAEPPEKAATSPPPPPPPGSLQDPFDYTSKYRAVNRCGKGNLSSRSEQERIMTNKSTMRQNSLKESLATEMELSHNEYANNGVAQDSADVYREVDQPKGKKGVDSFLAGIIKKSFSKSNQTMESAKRNVSVNGHLIPDRLVKKAEKLAGPIYPGQYWYDSRAGFWGAIGGPCLGIVPPYIEEFNYPMPEKCAAGNTGVFVNGRELNQKDLDLLSTRGLPAAKGRSYIVEISGRVLDEDSGEELDNLGKLAPTVEKVKHGFGMRAPKAAA